MEKGFSFIELLFTLAIMSIMTALAYPSYCNYMTRVHRLDGQMALLTLAQYLEQEVLSSHDYSNIPLLNAHSPNNWYTLEIKSASKTHYLLHAVPNQAQAKNDLACQTLTLDQTGAQGITQGPRGEPQSVALRCWQ